MMTDSDTFIITDAPPRRCRHCQAACDDVAKFCWMCGAPMVVAGTDGKENIPQTALIEIVEDGKREDPWPLRLAPLVAIPVVAVFIIGLYRSDPMEALFFGPALVIATLVAVGHQLLFRWVIQPKGTLQKAGVASSSLFAGIVAGFGTLAVTLVVAVIMVVVMVVSLIIGIMEFCGIEVGG